MERHRSLIPREKGLETHSAPSALMLDCESAALTEIVVHQISRAHPMQRENSASASDTTDIASPRVGNDRSEFEWPPPPDLWSATSASQRVDGQTVTASSLTSVSDDGTLLPRTTQRANYADDSRVEMHATGRPDAASRPSTSAAAVAREAGSQAGAGVAALPSAATVSPRLRVPGLSRFKRREVLWIALLGITAVIQGAYIFQTRLMQSFGDAPTPPRSDVPALTLVAAQPFVSPVTPDLAEADLVPTAARGDSPRADASLPPAKKSAGRLIVHSDPLGARVLLDGRAAGVTPLTLPGVAPGSHRLVISLDGSEVHQTVQVEGGGTASVIVPMASPAIASGRVAFDAPWEVDILEEGVLVGTSRTPALMLPAGPHNLRFVNDAFGYAHSQRVVVEPGRTVTVALPVPKGKLNVNALPWAEVSVDGAAIGETPLGDVSVDVGSHVLTFRHPELGEKTVSVAVKVGAPARVTVDMRK